MKLITATLILATCYPAWTNAQRPSWYNLQGKALTKFNWGCAISSAYPAAKLKRVVSLTMKQEDLSGFGTWGDRAFAFDLNGDHKPEYFVPLDCGGTGNCLWGLFALNPARKLGLINGQYIYVYRQPGRWPDLLTYTHLSAVEGSLMTFRFNERGYSSFGPRYPINNGEFDSEIQSGVDQKTPAFLEHAKPACESTDAAFPFQLDHQRVPLSRSWMYSSKLNSP